MKPEEMTPDMIGTLRSLKSPEERRTYLAKNSVELTADQLSTIAGGFNPGVPTDTSSKPYDECPNNPGKSCDYTIKTGRKRPGDIFGNLWPDVEYKCKWCEKTKFLNF